LLMALSIFVLGLLPFFDTSYFEKNRLFDIIFLTFFWFFAGSVVLLGWLGAQPIEYPYSTLAIIGTISYFGYFIFLFLSTIFSIFLEDKW
jgi:quinol-cytochrome oxidoreductase complex cytochrome b subunit